MELTFYDWLRQQTERTDQVGVFAQYVIKDKVFPRAIQQLTILLSRYEGMPQQRNGLKAAHAEWRRVRRQGSAS